MNLNCVIIDDEPLAQELLGSYVEKTPFLNLIGTYSSAVQAMKDLANGPCVHLMFLDIQMPGLNGLEFSKLVDAQTRIVFTTAFNQYAVEGYRVNALDYLLKPISPAAFMEAANRALEWFSLKQGTNTEVEAESSGDCIYVKSEYKLIQVQLNDILYVEGLKDYVKIYTESNPRPILSLSSMKAMEERLPSDRFLRVHRSFIVQKSKIRVIDRNRIVFGSVYIPVSDSYKQEWTTFLNNHSV